MAYAKGEFSRYRRLSKAETAILAGDVLERARQALHQSHGTSPALPADGPARRRSAQAARPDRGLPLTLRFNLAVMRSRISAAVAAPVGTHFEGVIIAGCMIVAASGWMIHLLA